MATGADRRREVAGAWALTALAALAGYLSIVKPADREVAAANARLRSLDAAGDRDAALLRRAAAAPPSDPARALPAFVFVQRTAPQTMLAALQAFASDAAQHGVALTSFAPAELGGHPDPGRQEVGLSLRGRYAGVLETIAALSSGPVLFDVRSLVVAQTFDRTGAPGVDATLDGVLFAAPTDVFDSGKEQERMVAAPASSILKITRDPFVTQPSPSEPPAMPADALPPLPGGAALPPNAGAGALVLRAVIDGRPARALVEVGDRPIVVRVGSRLGWATVTSIANGEVRLDDGRTLRLAGAQP